MATIEKVCELIYDRGTNEWGGIINEGNDNDEILVSAKFKKSIDPKTNKLMVLIELNKAKFNVFSGSTMIIFPDLTTINQLSKDISTLLTYVYHGSEKVGREIIHNKPSEN